MNTCPDAVPSHVRSDIMQTVLAVCDFVRVYTFMMELCG